MLKTGTFLSVLRCSFLQYFTEIKATLKYFRSKLSNQIMLVHTHYIDQYFLIFLVYCNVSGVVVANWTQENSTCPSSDMITVPVQSPSEQYWE